MSVTSALDLHPACEALPELTPERFAELVDSIREHGLEDPIVLHEGKVLDGRHRLRACAEAGVEPRFEEWDGRGETPVGFIALKQIRRDMTASQRAAWAAEYVLDDEEANARERQGARTDLQPPGNRSEKSRPEEAREKAAERAGVNPRYVSDAKRIREKDEALFDQVKTGEISLPEAGRRSALAEKIEAFPDDEREQAESFLRAVADNGNHTAKVIELADNLLSKPEEERVRIYVLHESEDPQDQSLALTEAAGLPPMPHPALPHLREAGRSLAKARRHVSPSEAVHIDRLRSEISDILSSLKEPAA